MLSLGNYSRLYQSLLYFVKLSLAIHSLTTPGKQRSVSIFGPSEAAGGDPEESDDESGDDGIEEFA